MAEQRRGSISPLQAVSCSCIICEQVASYSRLKTTLYVEKKRDITLRPIEIKWSDKVSPRVDPKLFYFWQCPFCGFTADHQFFLAPFKDGGMNPGRFRKLFTKYRDGNAQLPAVVERLKIDTRADTSVTIAALKQNLLAIFTWEMVEELVQGDSLNLAAYYLRLSWVFHELQRVKAKNAKVFEKGQTLLRDLYKDWPEISTCEGQALQTAYRYYQQALSKSATVNTVAQEVQVRLIMVRILLKLGKLQDAKHSLLECKARVSSFSHLVQKKMAGGGNFDEDALREMEQAKTKCQSQLNEVELIFEKLEAAAAAKRLAKAQDLLKEVAEQTYEEKVIHLKNHMVAEALIAKLLPEEKKKWSLIEKIAGKKKKT
ncbi:MAG: DUF2225 domain-containing protein [Oligoflexus sp.]